MNPILREIQNDFTNVIKKRDEVSGAWNFGSTTHGLEDEYSDVDIILLINGTRFNNFCNSLEQILSKVCDRIVLCWPEGFNSNAIVNNGYLLEKDNQVFQFDVFLLNSQCMDDYMCRLHYKNLKEEDIIFDKSGEVKALIGNNGDEEFWNADLTELENTYWYHASMTAKYIMRQDWFKLNNVLQTLLETHTFLLLTGYDKISWGGAANKLHFIPIEKQEHLKKYYCAEDFELIKRNLRLAMQWFCEDLEDVCTLKEKKYDVRKGVVVINNWSEIVNKAIV